MFALLRNGALGGVEHPLAQQVDLHPAVGTALDQLELVDVPLHRPGRPGESEGGAEIFGVRTWGTLMCGG